MREMKKRIIFNILVAMAILLCAIPAAAQGAYAAVDYVAVNTDTNRSYINFKDAYEKAGDGNTIKLLKDIGISGHDWFYIKKPVTFDLNGHTITGDTDEATIAVNSDQSRKKSRIYTNSGILTITDSSSGKTGAIINNSENAEASAIRIYNNSNAPRPELIINAGRIEGRNYGISALGARGCDITINGGVIKGDKKSVYIKTWGNFNINGGYFSDDAGNSSFTLPDNKILGRIGGEGAYKDYYELKEITAKNDGPGSKKDKLYASLEEAVNDAEEGDTIKLMRDLDFENSGFVSSGTYTLDLNGHKISGDGIQGKSGYSFRAVLFVTDGTLTVTDGSAEGKGEIDCTYSGSPGFASCIACGFDENTTAKVILKKGLLTSDSGCGIYSSRGEVSIEGGTIGSSAYAAVETYNAKLTILVDSTVIKGAPDAIISDGTTVIKGGTVKSEGQSADTAIRVKGGELSISGGTMSGPHGIEVIEGEVEFTNDSTSTLIGSVNKFSTFKKTGGTVKINGGRFSDDAGNGEGFILPAHKSLQPEGEYYVLKDKDPVITVDMGEGHAEFARRWAATLEKNIPDCEVVTEGNAVKFYYTTSGDRSVGTIQGELNSNLYEYYKSAGGKDNDQILGEYTLGQKTINNYESFDDVNNEMSASTEKISDRQTYYVLWEKPIKNIEYSVKKPVCGQSAGEYAPELSIKGKMVSHLNSSWLKSDGSGSFTATFEGEKEYWLSSKLQAKFGYYCDPDMTVAVSGGSLVNKDSIPEVQNNPLIETHTVTVYTSVTADHNWAGNSCSACEKTRESGSGGGSGNDGGSGSADDSTDTDVQQVVDKIGELRAPYDEAKVREAREAYDKLTAEQKDDSKVKEALKKLEEAEAAIESEKDQKAANAVSGMIAALPDDPSQAKADDVANAVSAYKALSDNAKALITEDELAKLQEALDYPASISKTGFRSVKTKKGKKAVITWKKKASADGYQIYCKAKGVKAKKVNINSVKTLKKTVKNLKSGKVYSFRICPYTKVENLSTGKMKTVYGKWSETKKVKAKK